MKVPQTRPIIAVAALLFCFFLIWDILHMPPEHDKTIAVQVLSAITTLLGMVLAYYFGATHKSDSNSPTNNNNAKKMKQVFWGISSLEDLVLKVDGVTLADPIKAKEMPDYYPSYEVLLDDTDTPVLAATTSSPIILTFAYGDVPSIISDFIGSKPRKPH